jgi:cytochrome P450
MAQAATTSRAGDLAIVDLGNATLWQDLHTPFRVARERHPVAFTPGGERLVLRYADVEALAGDPRLVSNAVPIVTRHGIEGGPLLDWWRRMMTNHNGPEHLRLRSLVSRAFTPRRVEAKRPRIRELARQLVEERLERGELDLVADLADPLPIRLSASCSASTPRAIPSSRAGAPTSAAR